MIINVVSVIVFLVIAGTSLVLTTMSASPVWVAIGVPLGVMAAMAPRVARPQRAPSALLCLPSHISGRIININKYNLFETI